MLLDYVPAASVGGNLSTWKKTHLVTARLAEHAGVFSVATGHGYMKIDETSLAMSAGVSEPS